MVKRLSCNDSGIYSSIYRLGAVSNLHWKNIGISECAGEHQKM